MRTPTWKKYFILICGLLENLIFSGPIMGWSALNYMLKQEGIYEQVCEYQPLYYNWTGGFANNATNDLMSDASEESKVFLAEKVADLVNNAMNLLVIANVNQTNVTFINEMEVVNGASLSVNIHGCIQQDKLLNLAYTIGTFCMGFTAFIWGFLLDKWGLRIVRVIINLLITAGLVLLCFTNKDRSYLIFPAVTLLCLAGVPLRIANMQLANLFPKKRSTVITFYSGAFSASAIIFVFLKYLFDFGLSFFLVSFFLVVTSLLMFPITFLLLPADKIREDDKNNSVENLFKRKSANSNLAILSPVTLEKFTILSSPKFVRKSGEKAIENGITKDNNPYIIKTHSQLSVSESSSSNNSSIRPGTVPLKISLWSMGFSLHQWWYSWLLTYMIMYVGSMNLWLSRVTDDIHSAATYTKIYGLVQVFALVLAPIAGLIMDSNIAKANQETDPFKRKIRRAQAGFWPILFTTFTLIAILACRFFDNAIAVCVSIVFITLLRSFIIAVASAYLRIRFHADHFNRLLGIMSTTGAFVTLLQFPLFVWESQSSSNAVLVNLFNCACTLIALLNPLHLLITPLQKRLFMKEEAQETQAKLKNAK